jgi:hypothetical protein
MKMASATDESAPGRWRLIGSAPAAAGAFENARLSMGWFTTRLLPARSVGRSIVRSMSSRVVRGLIAQSEAPSLCTGGPVAHQSGAPSALQSSWTADKSPFS